MKNKRLISAALSVVFMTFVMLSGLDAYGISKSAIKTQITKATSSVVKAEQYVKGTSYEVKQAQTLLKSAQAQVIKISTYGSSYRASYTVLTKRLNSVNSVINTKIKALAAAGQQVQKDISAADKAVTILEKLGSISKEDLAKNAAAMANLQNAVKAAQLAVTKLPADSTEYINFMARIDTVNTKITAVINEKAAADKAVKDKAAAAALKAKYAAEAAISKAELTMNTDTVRSNTFIENAKKIIENAKTAVNNIDSSSSDYKSFLNRINTLNAKLDDIISKKAAEDEAKLNQQTSAAAEKAVKALENASLSTTYDVKIVLDLEAVANLAVAKINDPNVAADFSKRINTVDQSAKDLQAKLDAAALAAKTPAKVVAVTAVNQVITVKFDKKPLSTVAAGDLKLTGSIGGAPISVAISSVSPVNDTTININVPSIAPIANIDQSVVYSVQYQGQAAMTAAAFVIPKIPYLTVVSATAINLKQIKVVFSKAVDKASAETIGNYLENGVPMISSYEKAELQTDKQSVIITYAAQKAQQSTISFTVMNVKNDTYTETITAATSSLSFMDVTPPTVSSVVANGSYSITVSYSEPVNGANVASAYQMDGYDLSAFGVTGVAYDDGTYPSKQSSVTITFGSKLSNGAHSFTVLASRVSDFGNYYVTATNTPVSVAEDTSKPTVVSSVATGSGVLDITFNKAVSLPSVGYIYVNGIALDSSAIVTYKDSSLKTVIEVIKAGMLINGVNLITMPKGTVYDMYGNSNDTSDIRFTVTATSASTAAVSTITQVSSSMLMINYATAMGTSATYTGYYSVKDSNGNIVTTVSSVLPVSNSSYAYYIYLGTALPNGTYTVTVSGPSDLYGNIVYATSRSVTITSSTTALPTFLRARATSLTQVELEYSKPLYNVTADDFYLNGSTPQTAYALATQVYSADNVTLLNGCKVYLTFSSGVLNTTASGTLATVSPIQTMDASGNLIGVGALTSSITDKIPPQFVSAAVINSTTIDLVFSENLSSSNVTYYKNDFSVTNGGTAISISSSQVVNNNTIELTLASALNGALTTIVTPKAVPSYVQDLNYNLYLPTTIDLAGITASSQATVDNPAIGTNDSGKVQVGTDIQATSFTSPTSGQTITWSSDNSSVASVNSSSGLVHPVSQGTANISYKVTNSSSVTVVSGTRSITVYPANTEVDPTYGTLQVGQGTVSPSGVPALSGSRTIAWLSSSTGIATVDANGVVTPVSAGSTRISYTISDGGFTIYNGHIDITIIQQAAVQNPTVGNVQIGQPTVTPGNVPTVSGGTIAWLSSNTGVATINAATGAITPVTSGITTISYTIKQAATTVYSGSLTINVWAATLTQNPTIPSVQVGGTVPSVQPNGNATNGIGQSIAWASDNTNVATVNASTGAVTPVAAGTANISYVVTDDASHRVVVGGSGTVTVIAPATSVAPTGSTAISVSGVTKTTVLTAPALTAGQTITWQSADTNIATVAALGSNTATVTEVAAGTVSISYTIKDASSFEIYKGAISVVVIP